MKPSQARSHSKPTSQAKVRLMVSPEGSTWIHFHLNQNVGLVCVVVSRSTFSKGLSLWISLDQSTSHRSQATEPGSCSILVQKRFIRRKCFSCPTPHMAIEGVSLRPKWLDPSKTLSFICSLACSLVCCL